MRLAWGFCLTTLQSFNTSCCDVGSTRPILVGGFRVAGRIGVRFSAVQTWSAARRKCEADFIGCLAMHSRCCKWPRAYSWFGEPGLTCRRGSAGCTSLLCSNTHYLTNLSRGEGILGGLKEPWEVLVGSPCMFGDRLARCRDKLITHVGS